MTQQSSNGVCVLCDARVAKSAVARHLAGCAAAHDVALAPPVDLFHVRVEAPQAPLYWLDLEIKTDQPLRRLDDLLRRTWLECCGHLSAFTIGGVRYVVSVDRGFGFSPAERSMTARMGQVLAPGERCTYQYDFGSTTYLRLRVLGVRQGCPGKPAARLLARNVAPQWSCAQCDAPATDICAFCARGEENPFCCAAHVPSHRCAEDESFLPVVNSPRMGVCGYSG